MMKRLFLSLLLVSGFLSCLLLVSCEKKMTTSNINQQQQKQQQQQQKQQQQQQKQQQQQQNQQYVFFKSKPFLQWVQDQPQYFQEIAVTGKPYQKKALLMHYYVAARHKGVYEVPHGDSEAVEAREAGMKAFTEEKNYDAAYYFFAGLAVSGRAIPNDYRLVAKVLKALGEPDRAFLWEIKAAEEGFAEAQIVVGFSYLTGDRMVEENHISAFRYLFASAEQGNPTGQFLLAMLYSQSDNARPVEKEIYYYSMLSALQGDVSGQVFYSTCYEVGLFVPKNYYKAYKWACIAKANGGEGLSPQAILRLEPYLTKQELSKAQQEAAQYIEKQRRRSFDKGHLVIMYQPNSLTAYVSYTTIPIRKYKEIISEIHGEKQYEVFAFVETNRIRRLYFDTKRALSKFQTGPATYEVDKSTLKQRLESEISSTERVIIAKNEKKKLKKIHAQNS
ncbi:MAG: sel1 repeat family protein [Desulfobacteraceae bacterium]|nr:sel1 repeat family protein [Desulfobacteraceae bacterium]